LAGSKDYTGTQLPRKLGIKENARLSVVRAPGGFALSPLPDGVRASSGAADVILLFSTSRADLERRFGALAGKLDPTGGLWVAWPKKASAIDSDLTFDVVQRTGLDAGLVDNKSCAIDQDWQALDSCTG
jgi:hypothetical protein